jgi:hypothetical protein
MINFAAAAADEDFSFSPLKAKLTSSSAIIIIIISISWLDYLNKCCIKLSPGSEIFNINLDAACQQFTVTCKAMKLTLAIFAAIFAVAASGKLSADQESELFESHLVRSDVSVIFSRFFPTPSPLIFSIPPEEIQHHR